jgi:hypothetical protein
MLHGFSSFADALAANGNLADALMTFLYGMV